MKAFLLIIVASLSVSCVYHEGSNEGRHPSRTRSYRQPESRQRYTPRHREQIRDKRWESMPYLPPFTMRWDCPAEPQMLGYVTR